MLLGIYRISGSYYPVFAESRYSRSWSCSSSLRSRTSSIYFFSRVIPDIRQLLSGFVEFHKNTVLLVLEVHVAKLRVSGNLKNIRDTPDIRQLISLTLQFLGPKHLYERVCPSVTHSLTFFFVCLISSKITAIEFPLCKKCFYAKYFYV